jgi:hypothetical protein
LAQAVSFNVPFDIAMAVGLHVARAVQSRSYEREYCHASLRLDTFMRKEKKPENRDELHERHASALRLAAVETQPTVSCA